jgi:hypothetical protein
MRKRRGVMVGIIAVVATALMLAVVGGAFAGKKTVKVSADLSGQDEVPPTGNGSGTAKLKLKKKKKEVCFDISFQGLTSDTTAAHVHRGDPGVNGAIVVPLFEGAQTSPATGCVDAKKKLIKKIGKKPAKYYVNVHTTVNPAGEIRGQLHKGSSSGSSGGGTGGGGDGGGY